eukprot:6289545-Prymnesium_polylepis.1
MAHGRASPAALHPLQALRAPLARLACMLREPRCRRAGWAWRVCTVGIVGRVGRVLSVRRTVHTPPAPVPHEL